MSDGEQLIAGIDEAGRGPLAGPVTAACVVLKEGFSNRLIADSKKLTAKQREEAFELVVENSLAYAVVSVGPRRIEQLNIREASLFAMRLAADRVQKQLQDVQLYFMVDGNAAVKGLENQETVIKGDTKIPEISAASIVAKVTRDRLMETLASKYPEYSLEKHRGYPTKLHKELIEEHGPSTIHRRTFAGVKEHFNRLY